MDGFIAGTTEPGSERRRRVVHRVDRSNYVPVEIPDAGRLFLALSRLRKDRIIALFDGTARAVLQVNVTHRNKRSQKWVTNRQIM